MRNFPGDVGVGRGGRVSGGFDARVLVGTPAGTLVVESAHVVVALALRIGFSNPPADVHPAHRPQGGPMTLDGGDGRALEMRCGRLGVGVVLCVGRCVRQLEDNVPKGFPSPWPRLQFQRLRTASSGLDNGLGTGRGPTVSFL